MSRTRKRFYRNRLPQEQRTIPIDGYGDDLGKYFRCWNCGFICKLGRDELTSSIARAGTAYTDYYAKSDPGKENRLYIGKRDEPVVLLELDSDGDPKEILHSFKATVTSGCPLCGCKQWKK